MDNLTHSLIGLVAGDVVARTVRSSMGGLSPERRRGLLVTMGVVGGNLPDGDLVLTYSQFPPDKISYLLEHRGYTHTVVGCLLLALLLYACVEVWGRLRRVTVTHDDRLVLGGMALLATLLHLAMDYLNSYGVHPFWPFDNRWVYGDSVFIIEPLYWLAVAPLFFTVRTLVARGVVALVVVGALAACVFVYRPQPALWIGASVLAVALFMVGKRGSARTAALTSGAMMLGVTAVFAASGAAAAHRLESLAARSFPGGEIIDHVLSPTPMNPLCWDVLLLEMNGDLYTARHGVLSNAPGVISAASCQFSLGDGSRTAPMAAVPASSSAEIRWLGEFSMPASRLASLVAGDCDAYAMMQFVRAPFARAPFAGDRDRGWIIGDLRFDREKGLSMAEIELAEPPPAERRCQFNVPWTPPRAELLREQ